MNQLVFTGNLAADPTLGTTKSSGQPVVNFTVIEDRDYRNGNGEKVSQNQAHRCQVFGSYAEVLARHLRKGSEVTIFGELVYNKREVQVVDEEAEDTRTITITYPNILISPRNGGRVVFHRGCEADGDYDEEEVAVREAV